MQEELLEEEKSSAKLANKGRRQKTFYIVSLQICLAPWNITPTETEKKSVLSTTNKGSVSIQDTKNEVKRLITVHLKFQNVWNFETEMPYSYSKKNTTKESSSLVDFFTSFWKSFLVMEFYKRARELSVCLR